MKIARFYGKGVVRTEEAPVPVPGEGQLLVKILASAICGSERGNYAREAEPDRIQLSGHEAVGEIADPNGSKRFQKGERVCVQIMNGCGQCFYCRKGLPIFCKRLQYENGCHAQYVAMPENCLVPISDDIPPHIAVLLGGDLMGVAFRATRQLPVKPGKLVFVSGGGPVGLGVAFMLKALGAFVVMSEPSDFRREYARARAGVDRTIDPTTQNVAATLEELSEGIGPEITVECSGQPAAQSQALDVTRCQGHVMFCGENYAGLNIVPSLQIIHKELNVHGAFYFAPSDVPEIVSMYRRGMNPEALISHRASIDRAGEMFDLFFAGKTGKVILDPWA